MTPKKFMEQYKKLEVYYYEDHESKKNRIQHPGPISVDKYLSHDTQSSSLNTRMGIKEVVRKRKSLNQEEQERIMGTFCGKGSPEDYVLTLGSALALGLPDRLNKTLQMFCNDYLGIDCLGFVDAYYRNEKLLQTKKDQDIPDYNKNLRSNPCEIGAGDALVWANDLGQPNTIKGEGRHIALVDNVIFCGSGQPPTRMVVVESPSEKGLFSSTYEITKCDVDKRVFWFNRFEVVKKGTGRAIITNRWKPAPNWPQTQANRYAKGPWD